MREIIYNKEFQLFLKEVKQKIYSVKNKAILLANRFMIELYFDIGKEIVNRQEKYGWGKSIVEEMLKMLNELKKEFGEKSGYSTSNLWRMRNFYLAYKDYPKLAQLVREISWSINILIFSKCKDIEVEYALQSINQSIGISTYVTKQELPNSLKEYLPIKKEFEKFVKNLTYTHSDNLHLKNKELKNAD